VKPSIDRGNAPVKQKLLHSGGQYALSQSEVAEPISDLKSVVPALVRDELVSDVSGRFACRMRRSLKLGFEKLPEQWMCGISARRLWYEDAKMDSVA
jgi:hypothetical protein